MISGRQRICDVPLIYDPVNAVLRLPVDGVSPFSYTHLITVSTAILKAILLEPTQLSAGDAGTAFELS